MRKKKCQKKNDKKQIPVNVRVAQKTKREIKKKSGKKICAQKTTSKEQRSSRDNERIETFETKVKGLASVLEVRRCAYL